ncbi:hypothetical protein ACJMK2_034291 [Sinanodonta woodiana]|uniref:Endonuclease/exonuclease/phosphatase domain-containing protein n=1 Tax=Sinanodonta woodiana TaxID=1069815 RepID=A0ABD3WSX1_SINWO
MLTHLPPGTAINVKAPTSLIFYMIFRSLIAAAYSSVFDSSHLSTPSKLHLSREPPGNSSGSSSSIGSPTMSSSPKPKSTTDQVFTTKNFIRILNINFQSVRKKVLNIEVLIKTTNSDIILGTETWLTEEVKTTEFFSCSLGYKVHRHDRKNDHHGGVMIALKDDLELLDVQKSKNLELISGRIKLNRNKDLIIDSYYRPPNKTDADEDYLNITYSELTRLKSKKRNTVHIIGGDYNLPDIDWLSMTFNRTNHYPQRVNQTFVNIVHDMGLKQMVNFPIRVENTLDLTLTTHPSFMIRCKPLPPIGVKSDHDIVLFDTSLSPIRSKTPRQKIILWKRANI